MTTLPQPTTVASDAPPKWEDTQDLPDWDSTTAVDETPTSGVRNQFPLINSQSTPQIPKDYGVFQPSQFSSGVEPSQQDPALNPDFELTRSIAQNPVGFAASLPQDVFDLAGKGALAVANLPTTIANKVRGATPQSADFVQPIDKASPNPFEINKLSDEDAKTLGISPAIKGVHDAVIDTVNGLTEPQSAFVLPLMGIEGLSKPATTAFAAQLAANLPDSIKNIADATTQAEKAKAWANLAIQGIMLKGAGEHAFKPESAPSVQSPKESPEVQSLVDSASKTLPLATKAVQDITGKDLKLPEPVQPPAIKDQTPFVTSEEITSQGGQNASEITSPTGTDIQQIREGLGRKAPLQQQGETAGTRQADSGIPSESQGTQSSDEGQVLLDHVENLSPTETLNLKDSTPTKSSEVTQVVKIGAENGKNVYQIFSTQDGQKLVGYSDNPIWEQHPNYQGDSKYQPPHQEASQTRTSNEIKQENVTSGLRNENSPDETKGSTGTSPTANGGIPPQPARTQGQPQADLPLKPEIPSARIGDQTPERQAKSKANNSREAFAAVQARANADKLSRLQVSVQSPNQSGEGGYVQFVDPLQKESDQSPTVQSLKLSGIDVPDFSKLPQGKYTYTEAVNALDKLNKESPVGETPAVNPQPPLSEASNKTGAPASESVKGEVAPSQSVTQQKYRIGKNPQLVSVVEKLPATDVEISNGEQPVRVKNDKTGEVSTVMEGDLKPVTKQVTSKITKPNPVDAKLKKMGYSDAQIAVMDKEGAKALAQRGELPIKRVGKGGPGAGEAGEPGTYSAIQSLADQISTSLPENAPITSKIGLIERLKMAGTDAKESFKNAVAKVVAIKDALWKAYTGLPEYGDEKAAVGRWTYALQRADYEARQFSKEIIKRVPDKLRREAITNYIQANGDNALLAERASKSSGRLKQGYQIAQHLTSQEVEIAKLLREYYDRQLDNGKSQDLLKDGLENYINQVWKKENPITRALGMDLAPSKLKTNFDYAKKRFYDSFFDGEQAGLKPEKDAGLLIALYDQSFNKTLAARAFLKDLHEGVASDGRPLVEVSGSGKIIDAADGNQKVIIKPKIKPEDASDYRVIDHPAMRGWKWVSEVDGKPVLVQGDLLVHPEIYQKLRNRLSNSAFRQNPVGRAILGGQSLVKQTMLSISGFHQVQEGLHALGHRINPTNLPDIDFSEPVTKSLVTHGLQLADNRPLEQFSEGLSSGGLVNKIPILGSKILKPYTEYLFQDYIPKLKLEMAKHALDRNIQRYQGKISNDQILEMTANQANAAFGELNYRYIGRNPTVQDAMRVFLLAPDFLESRAKFVGQAASPFGKEQWQALGLLAATMYLSARVLNAATNKGDPHFELEHAFSWVVGNHAYTLRTIPGDLLHLFSDPQNFVSHRLSPIMRTGFEYVSGRDDRGVKRDIGQQLKDIASSAIPLSLRKRDDQKIWEAFLNSFGVGTSRFDSVQTIQQKAQEYKAKNGLLDKAHTDVYDPDEDKYRPLRIAIENGDEATAKKSLEALKATIPLAKIKQHFSLSYNHPFTGSRSNDIKFQKSLSDAEQQELKQAWDLRKQRLQFFQKIAR